VTALLAVDGGQTALRMGVVRRGALGPVAEVGGFSHGDGIRGIAAAVDAARVSLALWEPVERVCLGLTGAPASADLQARLARLVAGRFDGAQVALAADMVTAHAGALGGEPGVVIVAGTGSVALGLAADGRAARADGLGFLLGDDGSGFAIGRAAVRAALRARESRGPATALEDAADAFFGGLSGLSQRIYASAPVRELAAFAPEVAAVARAGDAVATAIWRDAAGRLAATAAAALERTFPDGIAAVSHSGRLFAAEDLLLEPFKAALAERCPGARYRAPLGDALAGAARLVEHGLGRYGSLMHTTEGWSA
jgi:glucosamine kinase